MLHSIPVHSSDRSAGDNKTFQWATVLSDTSYKYLIAYSAYLPEETKPNEASETEGGRFSNMPMERKIKENAKTKTGIPQEREKLQI